MSHTVDVAQGHKSRGVVAFIPIVFGLGVSRWVPSLAYSRGKLSVMVSIVAEASWRNFRRRGSLTEEKEPGNDDLLDPDPRPSEA